MRRTLTMGHTIYGPTNDDLRNPLSGKYRPTVNVPPIQAPKTKPATYYQGNSRDNDTFHSRTGIVARIPKRRTSYS